MQKYMSISDTTETESKNKISAKYKNKLLHFLTAYLYHLFFVTTPIIIHIPIVNNPLRIMLNGTFK